MTNNRTVGNIRDVIDDIMTDKGDIQRRERAEMISATTRPPGSVNRTGKGDMIRDLARAAGNAGQRSGKGGTCGGGLGGQKAGGIKGGGKRKTHFGRKQGSS